jgi:hypothetical protein
VAENCRPEFALDHAMAHVSISHGFRATARNEAIMKRVFSQSIRFLSLLTALVVAPSGFCFAWCGPHGQHFNGQTRYMWSRTWHAQNSLAMPLGAYYVPRAPGFCGSGSGENGISGYTASALPGFEPVHFERLGQVPNELDIIGNMSAPASAPAANPRR